MGCALAPLPFDGLGTALAAQAVNAVSWFDVALDMESSSHLERKETACTDAMPCDTALFHSAYSGLVFPAGHEFAVLHRPPALSIITMTLFGVAQATAKEERFS